jgi:hypothetical protein
MLLSKFWHGFEPIYGGSLMRNSGCCILPPALATMLTPPIAIRVISAITRQTHGSQRTRAQPIAIAAMASAEFAYSSGSQVSASAFYGATLIPWLVSVFLPYGGGAAVVLLYRMLVWCYLDPLGD